MFTTVFCRNRSKLEEKTTIVTTNKDIPPPEDSNPNLFDNKAESININTLQLCVEGKAILVPGIKRIPLSKEEKEMDGAPQGEIYDIVVVDDNDLEPYESLDTAREHLKQCSVSTDSYSWADKHETVVAIRRTTLFHRELFEFEADLSQAIEKACEAVESSRSCNIKNGIMCLRAMARVFSSAITFECNKSARIIEVLLNRTGTGPRFICDMAYELLVEVATKSYIPPMLFVEALVTFKNHKNADVACRSHILASKCTMLLDRDSLTHDGLAGLVENLVNVLHQALLSTKRAKGRESAKDAFMFLHKQLGDTSFDEMLTRYLPESTQLVKTYRMLSRLDKTGLFETFLTRHTQTSKLTPNHKSAESPKNEFPISNGRGKDQTNPDARIEIRDQKMNEKIKQTSVPTPDRSTGCKPSSAVPAGCSIKQHIQMMKKQQQKERNASGQKLVVAKKQLISSPTSKNISNSNILTPTMKRSGSGIGNNNSNGGTTNKVSTSPYVLLSPQGRGSRDSRDSLDGKEVKICERRSSHVVRAKQSTKKNKETDENTATNISNDENMNSNKDCSKCRDEGQWKGNRKVEVLQLMEI